MSISVMNVSRKSLRSQRQAVLSWERKAQIRCVARSAGKSPGRCTMLYRVPVASISVANVLNCASRLSLRSRMCVAEQLIQGTMRCDLDYIDARKHEVM